MQEAGQIEEGDEPLDEDLRRFDKKRKQKRVSNAEWESATDPDARITRMKDGRTRLAYKAEHAIDLESELIVAAEVYHGDHGDPQTLGDTAMAARTHLAEAGLERGSDSPAKPTNHEQGGAKSDANGVASDPDLVKVVAAWPRLS